MTIETVSYPRLAATPLLYQHIDGRNLVAAPGSKAVAGDAGWHRVGPVEIEPFATIKPLVSQAYTALMTAQVMSDSIGRLMEELDFGSSDGQFALANAVEACLEKLSREVRGAMERIDVSKIPTEWCFATAGEGA